MSLFKKIRKLMRPQVDTFAFSVNESVGIAKANKKILSEFGNPLGDDFRKFKTSDTLCILGSGPSINDLTKQDYDFLSRHDSIGFNFWFAHDFVPDFYLFQFPEPRYLSIMMNLLEDKKPSYKDVKFICRGSIWATAPDQYMDKMKSIAPSENTYFMNEIPIHSDYPGDFQSLFDFFEIMGHMNFGEISNAMVKWRVTVGLLLSLAYNMGYKKVILFGIDMTDDTHFYDHPEFQEIADKYNLPRPEKNDILQMTASHTPVADYIKNLQIQFEERADCKVYNASRNSVLKDRIPFWSLEEEPEHDKISH